MRQGISWASALLLLSFGFVSVTNGQEGRPAGERPEANTLRTKPAEPESPATRGVPAQGNQAAAPRLVKVSGVLAEFVSSDSVSSSVDMTFAVYKDEVGGEALWTETQSVEVDKEGRYTALLGATQADGVPVELFPAGEPRWLGVEISGQARQSRTLLVSVPYALKALDAEKLSGKSLSDFVLAEGLGEQVRQVIQAQGQQAGQSTLAGAQQKQTGASSTTTSQTGAAGPKFPPSTFSGTTSNQIVLVQQNGTGSGLVASTPSSAGASALVGLATSTSTSNSVFQNGVYGQNNGSGAGVAGIATNPSVGVGVYGQSANFAGVFGNAPATSGFVTGVYGQSATGSGVAGKANASSGFTSGVSGDASASPNGTGVFGSAFQWVGVGGQATAPSGGPAFGVWGDSLSTGGTGVAGFADATSGYTNGVSGQSVSPNGNGVFGANYAATGGTGVVGVANATSGSPNGVLGQINATSGAAVNGQSFGTSGFADGVFGASSSPNGVGVSGNNNSATGGTAVSGVANATSGTSTGVYGQISAQNGAGVTGIATATSGFNDGVYGQNASNEGAAVSGNAVSTSGSGIGVVGTSVGTNGGIGAWGVSLATSGVGVGVRGDLEEPTASGAAGLFLTFSPTSVAGQFANASRQGLILQGLSGPFDATQKEVFRVDADGNLHITGNLTVDGTKSSTARLQDGQEVALYAVESPENWFEDFGSAQLNNGVAWVLLDASFAQAVNAAVTYHVFLTANGDSNGLYIARKTTAGFEVREHGSGTSNVAFDYRVVARRRGYETIRMLQIPERKTLEVPRTQIKMAKAHTNMEPVRIVPHTPLAPINRPLAPRPSVPQVPKPNVPQQLQPR